MIDDKVVDLAALQRALHLEEVFLDETRLDGVDQGHLFVNDKVGIVRHAVGQVDVVLKTLAAAVVDADVIDVFG